MSIDFEAIGKRAIEEVYGKIPEAPKGWEIVSFDEPSADEHWIGRSGSVIGNDNWHFVDRGECRLIVRRKVTRKLVGWTVRKLGRIPQIGEMWTRNGDFKGLMTCFGSGAYVFPRDEAVSVEPIYEDVPEPTE